MVVKLRLMRMGKKKQPTYRIVVADARSPRDGKFIEVIGTYAPRKDPAEIIVNNSQASDWLLKGAQPTETVKKLLELSGAWEEYSKARGVEYKPSKPLLVATKPSAVKTPPAVVEVKADKDQNVTVDAEDAPTSSSETEVE